MPKIPITIKFAGIGKRHREWWEMVKPANPSSVQVEECRRAFYAGFGSAILALRDEVSSFPDDVGVQLLEALMNESVAFQEQILRDHKAPPSSKLPTPPET